jgi:hypothetical protein
LATSHLGENIARKGRARLRGALRAVKKVAKLNLSFTPEDILK